MTIGRDFFLRDLQSQLRALPAAQRLPVRQLCALGQQKLTSAQLLWASDQTAEALRLAVDALAAASAAAKAAAALQGARSNPTGAAAPPGTATVPAADTAANETMAAARALNAAPAALLAIAAAAGAANGATAALNHEVTFASAARFSTLIRGTRALLAAARPWGLSVAGLKLRQAGRVGLLLLAAIVALGSIRRCLAEDDSFTVTASGAFDAGKYGADKATDGDVVTEWLLPSRSPGWLEVKFAPRKIPRVRVRNAINQPFKDRGTRDFRVECYRAGQLVHSSKHTFDKIEDDPSWLEMPIAVDRVDALRIVVDSHHLSGGGLSELTWK